MKVFENIFVCVQQELVVSFIFIYFSTCHSFKRRLLCCFMTCVKKTLDICLECVYEK